jgi:hypothetical protein
MKKIIIIILLAFANLYGQSQILTMNVPANANTGVPFAIELNPTGTGCTSQSISLNIGALTYSSSTLQPGATITTSGSTITINNITTSSSGGTSQTMYVYVNFPCGTTCNGATQNITGTLTSVGCGGPQTVIKTVTAVAANNVATSIQQIDPNIATAVCFGTTVKYTVGITNYGSTYNIISSKLIMELAKCASIVGVYYYNTFTSLTTNLIGSSTSTQTIDWSTPNLICNSQYYYDVYVKYPCASCVTGLFTTPKVHATGSSLVCSIAAFQTANVATTTLFTNTNCINCNTAPGTLKTIQGYFPCPTACNTASSIQTYFTIPPGNASSTGLTYTMSIPAGLNITGVTSPTLPCVPTIGYWNGSTWSSTLLATATKVRWVFACMATPPLNLNVFNINFSYSTTATPASGASLSFPYSLTDGSGSTLLSGTYTGNVSACLPTLNMVKLVKKIADPASSYSYNSTGAPGDSYTYRISVKNSGSGGLSSSIIEDVLNTNHVYMGNLKFFYGSTLPVSLAAVSGSSLTIAGLGTASITTPTIGSSGTISIAGFNLPAGCTSTDYLYFEFDVKVNTTVTAGTSIPNYFSVKQGSTAIQNSTPTNIGTVTLNKIGNYMYVKCPLSDVWGTTTTAKNGGDVDFKMKIVNEGSLPITLVELLNVKPHVGDKYEVGLLPRNSGFQIDYKCATTIIVNPGISPPVTFNYNSNNSSMDRTMLSPPSGSGNPPITTICGTNANWLRSILPPVYSVPPGGVVEIIFRGTANGTTGIAHNSFSFKAITSSGAINSTNSNTVDIANDGIGCPEPCPCPQDPEPMLMSSTIVNGQLQVRRDPLKCGATYTNKLECFKTYTVAVTAPCGPNCQPDDEITTILQPNGVTIIGNTLIANQVGTYTVTIKVKCAGKWCNTCVIKFVQTKNCEPPCDNCKDKVRSEFDAATSTVNVKNYPLASTLNALILLNGTTDTYTQVRANIVDFQISSDNPACLQCYNTPNQWGSIINGSLLSFTPAITNYTGVSTFSALNNPREIVFSAATPTAIPINSPLNLTITLPGISTISCCCIYVELYVKITYRNNKCEECTKMERIAMKICPKTNGDNGTPTGDGGTVVFDPSGGHPQYRVHTINREDAKILNVNPNTKNIK